MTTKAKKYIPATKPITIYFYGDGKGKTTAALGVALRATGHNLRCLILQAIKDSWPSGERQSIGKYFDNKLIIKTVGRGFVGIGGDKLDINDHRQAARKAISTANDEIASGKWDIVVLDEYSDLVSLRLIDVKKLLALISRPRGKTDIIITGHKPLSGLIKLSDIVTEMKKVKHHFDRGIIAKKGIDF